MKELKLQYFSNASYEKFPQESIKFDPCTDLIFLIDKAIKAVADLGDKASVVLFAEESDIVDELVGYHDIIEVIIRSEPNFVKLCVRIYNDEGNYIEYW